MQMIKADQFDSLGGLIRRQHVTYDLKSADSFGVWERSFVIMNGYVEIRDRIRLAVKIVHPLAFRFVSLRARVNVIVDHPTLPSPQWGDWQMRLDLTLDY